MSQLANAGRLLLAPFAGVAKWYNRTAQSHPFTVGVITTGLKTSAADVFAQKVRSHPAACNPPRRRHAGTTCRAERRRGARAVPDPGPPHATGPIHLRAAHPTNLPNQPGPLSGPNWRR